MLILIDDKIYGEFIFVIINPFLNFPILKIIMLDLIKTSNKIKYLIFLKICILFIH